MTGLGALLLQDATDVADLEVFLGRLGRMNGSALVRLRGRRDTGYLTAYTRLPFDVLVGRSVRGLLDGDQDVTVAAADLAAALAGAEVYGQDRRLIHLPARQDSAWRGALPPASGWRCLDAVPVATVRRLVAAGIAAFRKAQAQATSPRAEQAAVQALLDHETLTVSDESVRAVLPLRVLHAVWRMGFLGEQDTADCTVSVAGGWSRLAAPYGSAYRHLGGLSLLAH